MARLAEIYHEMKPNVVLKMLGHFKRTHMRATGRVRYARLGEPAPLARLDFIACYDSAGINAERPISIEALAHVPHLLYQFIAVAAAHCILVNPAVLLEIIETIHQPLDSLYLSEMNSRGHCGRT
jgi:hypothetical protein